MPQFDQASGMLRYDVREEGDLAELIHNGMIWRGGPKTQRRAVELLLTGRVPLNDRVPTSIGAYVRAKLNQPTAKSTESS